MEFNDIMANIQVSSLDLQKTSKLTVVGSKKMVVFDDIAENKIAVYNKSINSLGGCEVLYPEVDLSEPLRVELEHFYDCITNNKECITGINHILEVVKVLSRG